VFEATLGLIREEVFMKSIVTACRFVFICLMVLLGNSETGNASTDLKLVQTASGVYSLQGTDFKGVAGTDVIIKYDKLSLGNPRIVWGNLAAGYTVVNTNQSGQIRIAAVDVNANATAPGTGTFATVTFDIVGTPSGNITATAKLIDIRGASLATPVSVAPVAYSIGTTITSGTDSGNESVPVSGQATETTASEISVTGSSGNLTASGYRWVTISTDGSTTPEKEKEEPSVPVPEAAPEGEKQAVTANEAQPQPDRDPENPVKDPERKLVVVRSVLEEFRLFQGEKTAKALQALFKNKEYLAQEPPIALSDGNTKVKLLLERCPSEKQTPNFLIKQAKLISLKTGGNSEWVVELLPDKGAYEATVMLSEDCLVNVIPLTIAPPLAAGNRIGLKGNLTEADFNLFLKKRGTEKAPCFDLNNDGKRDYIDDYIFTANFIARNGHVAKKKSKKAQK
jgi:hypothetical protein